MNAIDLSSYRLRLTEGFLQEAERDFVPERWRSCVDNAQLSAENSGKSLLAAFGIVPKTHDPAQQLAQFLRTHELAPDLRSAMEKMLPDLPALSSAEHFLNVYGDEIRCKLPWEIFDKNPAMAAVDAGD